MIFTFTNEIRRKEHCKSQVQKKKQREADCIDIRIDKIEFVLILAVVQFAAKIQRIHVQFVGEATSRQPSRRWSSDGVDWIQIKAAVAVVVIHSQLIPHRGRMQFTGEIRRHRLASFQFLAHTDSTHHQRSV